MKIKKILLGCAIGLVLLFVLALFVVAFFLDGIVKTGVETVGPRIVQVPVTLESIHIGILSGSAKVKGLVLGNPAGYKTPNAVSVGLAEVSVDVASALSDKIVIHSIHVEAPEITFEGGLRDNNLFKIRDNLTAGAATSPNAPTAAGAKSAKKIEVDDFLITNAVVHLNFTGLGGLKKDLRLPAIHLTDLGKGDAGMTPAELTAKIIGAITTSTIQEVTDAVTNLGKGAADLGKGAGKAAGNAIKNVTSGLGGLFQK
jgi:hypothetical protein